MQLRPVAGLWHISLIQKFATAKATGLVGLLGTDDHTIQPPYSPTSQGAEF